MENLLFVLALLGIILGAYSLFLPTLRRRGFSLPLMRLVDDDDDDVDIDEDLDQPLDKAFAARAAKQEKEAKPAREPKQPRAAKAKGGGKASPIPERFVVSPGAEMSPLSSKKDGRRSALPKAVKVDEDDPEVFIEHPNAGLNLDDELDPELQALLDADDASKAEAEDADEETEEAPAADIPAAEAVPEPVAAAKPSGDFDMLSLFEETEVKDKQPPALRDALQACTIEELRAEASAMRAILAGADSSGKHAA